MAMTVGGELRRGIPRELDVTPVKDLVLVLAILFMVIIPVLTTSFWGHRARSLDVKPVVHRRLQADREPPMLLHAHVPASDRGAVSSDRARSA